MFRRAVCVPCLLSAVIFVALPSSARSQIVLQPGLGGVQGGRTVPTAGYDAALVALAAGDFASGLEIASQEYRGGIRAGAQRWIDSIAAAMAVGEANYELGRFREAIAAYDEALLLWATYGDWLLAVQFPQQPLRGLAQQRVATWGRSQRTTAPAAIPDPLTIRQGGADPQQVLKQGGVLTSPADYPIRPQEIVRSLVISLYRRAEILGELARDGAALDDAAKALIRRPAPPNHWSQSWIDVSLGVAYWAQGKADQATPLLNRGLIAANQFDHPLTSWGLIVLGRIALDADQPAAALKYFEEATYTAADYGDARALEEAFRLAFTAHMAAGTGAMPPAFGLASEWARANLPAMRARLLAMQAEGLAVAGNLKAASAALDEIDGRLLRGDFGRGTCGIQAAYAAALVAYRSGEIASGDTQLDRALSLAQPRTPKLFQTARLVELVMGGATTISDRQADALFTKLLGDPAPRDFTLDPVGTLATMSAPRREAFEAWLAPASRRGHDAFLAAGEARLRSHWLSSQPLGGRRTALETLAGAAPEVLPRAAAARRAALLARHPDFARVLDEAAKQRPALIAALAAPAGGPAQDVGWDSYAALGRQQRQFIAALAASREPTTLDFPPLDAPADVRRRLPDRHLILSFQWTAAGLAGFLESNARVATWQIKRPVALAKEIAGLTKAIGIVDAVAPVSTERMLETEWPAAAERVERLLFENSKVSLGSGVEELVIVPDGLLWYLPFELLPVGSAREVAVDDPAAGSAGPRALLRDACRIRYAPTRSLAVRRFEPAAVDGMLGVQAVRPFRGDRPEVGAAVTARFAEAFDRVVSLSAAGSAALAASLCDRLVLADELVGDGPIAERPLAVNVSGKPGFTFGDWLSPPPKRPQLVIVPGLQTEMADGLAKLPARPGDDLFVAATDLLAAGATTAVVSRWRVGGKLAVDLVEEFLRDLDVEPDADDEAPQVRSRVAASWQRAVDVVTAEEPDVAREPRVKQSPGAVLGDAKHPFFWAGYVLVDCGRGTYEEPAAPARAPAAAAPPKAAP
ncbi:MAG: CHAT domain-containing protein [Planctomycetia bacterium]